MKKLAIVGASGHGKAVADIARRNGYKEIVFLDDDKSIHACGGYKVVGRSSEAKTMDAHIIALAVQIAEGRYRSQFQRKS